MWWRSNTKPTETERLLSEIVAKLDSIAKNNERATTREQMKEMVFVDAVKQQVSTLVESLSGEPFRALKKWIDTASMEISRRDEIERNYRERERQLLYRWDSQVRDLQGRIESLERRQSPDITVNGG